MDPNGNRLNLNFGFDNRQFTPQNNRAYPTTPSTFPQPMYSNQGGQDYMDPNMYNQGYFMNNPYAQQQPQQQQQYHPSQQQQYAHAGMVSPQQPYSPRSPYQANDGTNGLVQQFSNHSLDSPRRNAAPPGQRQRTGNSPTPGQPQGHLAPNRSSLPAGEEDELPRHPERYSENVHKRGKAAKELVTVFFRENIERARDRNVR